jgi:hypothetical protein
VLLLVNEINANGSRLLPAQRPLPISQLYFLDPSGERILSPLDVLLVIGNLNTNGQSGGGGEGEGFFLSGLGTDAASGNAVMADASHAMASGLAAATAVDSDAISTTADDHFGAFVLMTNPDRGDALRRLTPPPSTGPMSISRRAAADSAFAELSASKRISAAAVSAGSFEEDESNREQLERDFLASDLDDLLADLAGDIASGWQRP